MIYKKTIIFRSSSSSEYSIMWWFIKKLLFSAHHLLKQYHCNNYPKESDFIKHIITLHFLVFEKIGEIG